MKISRKHVDTHAIVLTWFSISLPSIDLLDQNLVGASSPQADLKPALIAYSLLLCMKNKQKPTKPTSEKWRTDQRPASPHAGYQVRRYVVCVDAARAVGLAEGVRV
jgi:hypothetical protein